MICTVADCTRVHYARGWCDTHYKRWLRHGDLTRGRNPYPTYATLHSQLTRSRGSAGDLPCSDCGSAAHEWAYDHTDPEERIDHQRGHPYSLNLDRYIPLCVSCHRSRDMPRGSANAKLSEYEEAWVAESSLNQYQLAELFGVAQSTISRIRARCLP